jgi:hypothetical protein
MIRSNWYEPEPIVLAFLAEAERSSARALQTFKTMSPENQSEAMRGLFNLMNDLAYINHRARYEVKRTYRECNQERLYGGAA